MKKINLLICILFFLGTITTKAQIITTFAGNGYGSPSSGGYSGDGGQATAAEFYYTSGVAVDAYGNIYISDAENNRIRMVNTSGVISTVVGTGVAGYSGNGGQATAAKINMPWCITLDASGNLYIADRGNYRIRKVNTSGIITTIAGDGYPGYSGDGGPATAAKLNLPSSVTVDASGNIYIADTYNHRIRMVNTSGIISTFAGNGIGAYSGDGGAATDAELFYPYHVALDASGNVYIADWHNYRIRMVNTSGIISTFAGNGSGGYSGNGGLATAAQIGEVTDAEFDANGNLYILQTTGAMNEDYVRKINTSGIISTVAGIGNNGYSGDGGQATAAELHNPFQIAFDAKGNYYIADYNNNRIREVYLSLSVSGSVITEVSCYGGNNGSASATAGQGTTPYTYSWTPSGGTNSTAASLGAGTYTITVTDNKILTGSAAVIITQSTLLSVSANVTSDVNCNGANTGNASASPSGGTTPYTYSWSNGTSTVSTSNPTGAILSAGTYTITVTDSNECTVTAIVTITQPASPMGITIASETNTCSGDSAIANAATGGTSPYTYSWSPGGGTNLTTTGLSPGTYTITVTDANSCTAAATATISTYTVATPVIDSLNSDSTSFFVSNKTAGVSYSWTLRNITGNYAGIGDTAYLPVWPRKATLIFYADSGMPCSTLDSIHILHNIALPSIEKPYPRWSKRGMYLEWTAYYIDSTYDFAPHDLITHVVNYCRDNHITYVLMDGLQYDPDDSGWVFGISDHWVDSIHGAHLAGFIDSLKTRGGVEQVGVVCYNNTINNNYDSMAASIAYFDQDDNNINLFNYGLPWNKKIDVLSLDEEFWIDPNTNKTYGNAQYTYSVNDFHTVHMPMLKAMYDVAHECSDGYLRVEDYIETPLDPWGNDPHTDTALYQLKVGKMEIDSIGRYTDRLLLSSYTDYHTVLWNEGDFIQIDSEIALNPYHAYYKKEIWPVFSAENYDSGSCLRNWSYYPDDNFSGSNLCTEGKMSEAEWIEQQYFDSLSTSENKHIWTNNLNGTYAQDSMKADTDFQILGSMWFDYLSLDTEKITFDTLTSGVNQGYLRFYVTVGHDVQYPGDTAGPPITVTASVHGGKPPYTYTWYNVDNGDILFYSTAGNTYTTYWDALTRAYPVSQLAVVVTNAAHDTNVTDYLNIYPYCSHPAFHKPVKRKVQAKNTITNISSVKIYPNPNQGSFTLTLQNVSGTSQIEIYNILGEKVYVEILPQNQNYNTIDLNNQSNGVYFYRVLTENGDLVGEGKIVIEK